MLHTILNIFSAQIHQKFFLKKLFFEGLELFRGRFFASFECHAFCTKNYFYTSFRMQLLFWTLHSSACQINAHFPLLLSIESSLRIIIKQIDIFLSYMLYIYEHGNLSEKCKTLLFTIKMSLYHVHDLLYFYWKNKQHVSLKLMRSTTCNTAIYIDCEIVNLR